MRLATSEDGRHWSLIAAGCALALGSELPGRRVGL